MIAWHSVNGWSACCARRYQWRFYQVIQALQAMRGIQFTKHQGVITKRGTGFACRLLIEATCAYRLSLESHSEHPQAA